MNYRTPISSFISLLLFTACTLDLKNIGSPDESSGDTEGASSGATTGAPGSTSEPPATTGGPTTEAPLLCEDPSVAAVGPAVKVLLRNNGASPIWVDRTDFCGERLPFDLFDAANEPQNLSLGLCEFTCGETLLGDCACQAGCATPGLVVRIDPGATYESGWTGGRWATLAIAEECSVGCELECVAREQAPSGQYKLVARASTVLLAQECVDCDCVANADGWCEVMADRDPAAEIVIEGMLDYPTQTEILIEFP